MKINLSNMGNKEILKEGTKVLVYLNNKLTDGEIIKTTPVNYLDLYVKYEIKATIKKVNLLNEEYDRECKIIANNVTVQPGVDINIDWSPAKGVGDRCFVFLNKSEYHNWVKNEYKFHIQHHQYKLDQYKYLLENYVEEI